MIQPVCAPQSHKTIVPLAPSFEALLPAIQRIASYTFRKVRHCLREDLIAETIANAYPTFTSLVQWGLVALI